MPDRRSVIFGLSATALGACQPRPVISPVPGAGFVGTVRDVFVGTTRADENGKFGGERSTAIHYARYAVSVPPSHQVGRIETPRKGARPDPARDFVTAEVEPYRDTGAFRTGVSRALARSGQRDAVLYVHGFNNSYAEGIYRIAQIGYDLNIPGVALHYSWPSAAEPLNYAYDRDSALFARDGLERLLVEARAAGVRQLTLVAHSMGALLAMETLRQIEIGGAGRVRQLVQAVVLFSPDIDVELFRAQALRIGHLPDPFVILTSRRDRALTLSARLTGKPARLGNLDDYRELSDLKVLVLDVSAFGDGTAINHFPGARSPTLLALFSRVHSVDIALGADRAGRPGLLPGTVLTLQNATAIILSPITAVAQ